MLARLVTQTTAPTLMWKGWGLAPAVEEDATGDAVHASARSRGTR
jgi:hypothetical protein